MKALTSLSFPDMSKKPCCLTAQVNRVHNDDQIQRETEQLYLSLSLSTKGLSTNPVYDGGQGHREVKLNRAKMCLSS